jgi:hypothetical protein
MQRLRWKVAAAALVTAFAVTRVDTFVQSLTADSVLRGGVEPGGRFVERLTDASKLVQTLCDAVGQYWYATVATYGLAGVGFVVAWARWRGVDPVKSPFAQRVTLATALVTVVLISFSSAMALPPDGRVSNHVYFRYIAFLMPVFVMLAGTALIGADGRRARRLIWHTALLVGVTGFLVLARMSGREYFERFDTPEVSFLTYTFSHLAVAQVTVISMVLLCVFAALVGKARSRPVAIALVGVLALNVAAMEVTNLKTIRPMSRYQYATAPLLKQDLKLGPKDVIATSQWVSLGARLNHQREVYWEGITEFDHRAGELPSSTTGRANCHRRTRPWSSPRGTAATRTTGTGRPSAGCRWSTTRTTSGRSGCAPATRACRAGSRRATAHSQNHPACL